MDFGLNQKNPNESTNIIWKNKRRTRRNEIGNWRFILKRRSMGIKSPHLRNRFYSSEYHDFVPLWVLWVFQTHTSMKNIKINYHSKNSRGKKEKMNKWFWIIYIWTLLQNISSLIFLQIFHINIQSDLSCH